MKNAMAFFATPAPLTLFPFRCRLQYRLCRQTTHFFTIYSATSITAFPYIIVKSNAEVGCPQKMGNDASKSDDAEEARSHGRQLSPPGPQSSKADNISYLIDYAKQNYESNPTDSLLALMQALTLNGGKEAADQAMARVKSELGSEIADHVLDRQGRMERAVKIVEEMLQDETTMLYQQGNQHILKQAMEDGSSVVCSKCNGMVPASRWQQHQEYWCDAIDISEG